MLSVLSRVVARGSGASRGIASSTAGLLITTIIQLVSVPALLYAFGVNGFAAWLVLNAVPAYVSLSDFGLGSASATEITKLAAIGNRTRASQVFTSSRRLLTLTTVVIGAAIALYVDQIGAANFLNTRDVSGRSAGLTFLLLVISALFSIQASILEGGYRASGMYPRGVLGLNLIRLAEFAGVIGLALSTHRIVAAAAGGLAMRALATFVYRRALLRASPWLVMARHTKSLGLRYIRHLILPALGALSLPLGNALSNQGILLVLSSSDLSREAVVSYATVKTICSVVRQVNNVLNHGIQGELTIMLARNRVRAAVALMFRSMRWALMINLLLAAGLWAFGTEAVAIWSHGELFPSRNFVLLLVLTTIADTPWLALVMLPLVENRHSLITSVYAVSSVVSVVLCALLLPSLRANSAAVALFAVDVLVTPVAAWYVVRNYVEREPPTRWFRLAREAQ